MCRSLVFIILKFLLWMRFLSEFHRAFHCYRKYQVSSKLEMRGLEAFLAFYAVFTPEKQKGGLTPTHLAIVMEYGAGGELFERICNAGRFNEDEVVLTPTHLAIVMEYGACGELFERICNAGRLSEDEVVLTPTHLAIVMKYGAGGELFERICNACRFSEDEVVLTPTHLAIVMEYGAGGELFERICNAGRFSEDEYVICFGNEDGLCFAKVKFNYEKLRGALECFSDFEKKTNLRIFDKIMPKFSSFFKFFKSKFCRFFDIIYIFVFWYCCNIFEIFILNLGVYLLRIFFLVFLPRIFVPVEVVTGGKRAVKQLEYSSDNGKILIARQSSVYKLIVSFYLRESPTKLRGSSKCPKYKPYVVQYFIYFSLKFAHTCLSEMQRFVFIENSDMEIELGKRRSISRGKRSMLREYEKPAKRQECIPKRKLKRTKNTLSKCPVYESDFMHVKVNNILQTSSSDGSMDGQMEPSNCFGNVDIDKSAAYYRSNIKTALKDLNDLKFKDHHLDELKLTPFWMFFDISCENTQTSQEILDFDGKLQKKERRDCRKRTTIKFMDRNPFDEAEIFT
ncbi:hypothetical protein ACS0TY_001175 [Phlomoides rotata]